MSVKTYTCMWMQRVPLYLAFNTTVFLYITRCLSSIHVPFYDVICVMFVYYFILVYYYTTLITADSAAIFID